MSKVRMYRILREMEQAAIEKDQQLVTQLNQKQFGPAYHKAFPLGKGDPGLLYDVTRNYFINAVFPILSPEDQQECLGLAQQGMAQIKASLEDNLLNAQTSYNP